MVAIRGHFDGKVFVPDEPVDLPSNRPLVMHVEMSKEATVGESNCSNLWQLLEANTGSIEAPSDWAAEHDHYLYGTPKDQTKAG